MKYINLLAVSLATTTTALSILNPNQAVLGDSPEVERYLIELEPGETRWVTEDEKWALKRVIDPRPDISLHETNKFTVGGS